MSAARAEAARRPRRFARGRPWRDNLEALTMAVIVAVLLKYFLVEAYKIPTGSMQPTLLGWDAEDGEGVHDRVLVDRLSFHFRDPARFEVVVFKYPLDRSRSFIKRVVGLPQERLKLEHGDLWRAEPGSQEWTILRKPPGVERALLRRLATAGRWAFPADPLGWSCDGDDVVASGPGSATFPGDGGDVLNRYLDGYPANLLPRMGTPARATGGQFVSDLRFEAHVAADERCTRVVLELREGDARYRAELPGPAAPPDARPRLVHRALAPARDLTALSAPNAWRLPPGRAVRVAVQNIDDRVRFEVDGEALLSLDVPAAARRQAGVRLVTEGGGARFRDARVWRDVHYTTPGKLGHTWDVPAGCYVMLGDNTQDSADSREWELTSFHLLQGDDVSARVRGDQRPGENPRVVTNGDGRSTFYFVDEWGERRRFTADEAHHASEPAPFVRRELIIGRALLVFWPLKVSWGVYRLKWIR